MKRKLPDLLTVIVPRHPERGSQIAEQLRNANLAAELRSEGKLPESGTDIYIGDTIGELGLFYALATVAFIGGSLVPKGGQNPVEAIKLGAVVLTGPNWKNFTDAYDALLRVGGAKEVTDAESMAETALTLLQDLIPREVMRERADRVISSMSGALPRTLAELEPYLPKAALQHAS